ncbi:hypothetical protein COCMIDRAFT_38777 [Bipolaris oryzae ATCC 44560]|uniref:Xylanolytic transcriptional activator regulatory domain-containing protein n=1 Tax=Bipolaris oryzae ATCC 44560 TaxID=930090 RepID=W6Z0P4_COCMI|nr:uncharacterized protein COCMIDRAFT_38777 [Bipolaris oryzae ATCC 44560]EUC43243.1 hypothetical protein COCMIDRAFT_38777 [Bipolaris oryzae ATCC 44560]
MEHMHDENMSSERPAGDERSAKRRRTSMRLAREVGLMRNPTDRLTGFVGSASGIFFIRSVYGAISRSRPVNSDVAQTPISDIVPGEDDHLPLVKPNSSERLWKESEVILDAPTQISFQEMIAFSASYFANWHPFYPFLHAPTILGYFDEFAQKGIPGDNSLKDLRLVILRAIHSTSLADHRQSNGYDRAQYPACLVFLTYESALDSLQAILSRPTTILALQAALSVQIFLVSMLRLNAASRVGGLITRMAMQLGLHRCPARFSAFSSDESELRQRVFWSIYTIDRFLSQSMGLPLSLHDYDIDVCFPLTEHHVETQSEHKNQLRLLHLLAQQARIRGEIIELRHKSVHFVHNDPTRATAITAKLSQWWNDVENYIDPDEPHEASRYATMVLTLLKHESVISFYRPALAASRKDVEYDVALQKCIGSARSIISNLHSAIKSESGRGEATSRSLSLLWPSCTWAVWISTFILFYAANGKHIAEALVIRLSEKSLQILEHLSQRGSAWPEASSAAIRDLRARMSYQTTRYASAVAPSGDMGEDGVTGTSYNVSQTSSIQHDPLHLDKNSRGTADNQELAANPDSELLAGSGGVEPTFGMDDNYWNTYMTMEETGGMTFSNLNGLDPFSGFDIPFWFDQEQHWDFTQ